MEKKISYVVEVAKYDCNEKRTEAEENARFERAQNGVDTYEDFQIQGIYEDKAEAEKLFTTLRDAQVKAWEENGEFEGNTTPYNPFKKVYQGDDGKYYPHFFMSNNPSMENNDEPQCEEWLIYANTPNQYWICRYDNDMEYRIRIREYVR